MAEHEALAVFVGDWHAEGTSYGGPDQSPGNPRAGASPWTSIHTARWHSGGYFVVHDERANGPFDTLSLMGWESERDRYFVRAVENHGFTREYDLAVDGRTWTFTGQQERATHTFDEDGRTQTIVWERLVGDDWLPLCDRVARRVD